MCDVCKLGHVTRYCQKMLENFPPKMGTVYINSRLTLMVPDMYKGQKQTLCAWKLLHFLLFVKIMFCTSTQSPN